MGEKLVSKKTNYILLLILDKESADSKNHNLRRDIFLSQISQNFYFVLLTFLTLAGTDSVPEIEIQSTEFAIVKQQRLLFLL